MEIERVVRKIRKQFDLDEDEIKKFLEILNKPKDVWEILRKCEIFGMGCYVEKLIPLLVKEGICKWKGSKLVSKEIKVKREFT